MDNGKLLRSAEVREQLRIGRDSLRKLIEQGAFPNVIKLGNTGEGVGRGEYRIPQSDVDAFIKSRRAVPAG